MSLALAAVIASAVVLPHRLEQSSLPPTTGIALWSAVLSLRALIALSVAAITILYLPATELFGLFTRWCLHAVVPFLTTHLGFDGHRLGDVAVLAPALVIVVLAVSAAVALSRAAAAARGLLRRDALGAGPRGSLIVGGPEVVVAAAGLRSPRVVVSAGALVRLDDDELAAGLEHEWGHVRRRHALIAACGQVCHAMSRVLPCGRRALALLHFHLERDADEYAVACTGDRLALASAISKAAGAEESIPGPAWAMLGGGSGVSERLRLLLSDHAPTQRFTLVCARLLTAGAGAIALGLIVLLPALLNSPAVVHYGATAHGCPV